MHCPAVSDIQQVVAAHYAITMLDLLSRRRSRAVARPRQVAMYLARHLTQLSLPEIGRHFDHRDHTTVSHAVTQIDRLMRCDRAMAGAVAELQQQLLEPGQGTLPLE
jgi:chromosomal replication initiator protein